MPIRTSSFNDLPWVAKRVGLIVSALLITLFVLSDLHLSEDATILLAVTFFILAHLWLLLWLTYSIRFTHRHGELVSLQFRRR